MQTGPTNQKTPLTKGYKPERNHDRAHRRYHFCAPILQGPCSLHMALSPKQDQNVARTRDRAGCELYIGPLQSFGHPSQIVQPIESLTCAQVVMSSGPSSVRTCLKPLHRINSPDPGGHHFALGFQGVEADPAKC